MKNTPLRTERERVLMTLEQLAAKTKIPYSTIRYIDAGLRQPKYQDAITIAAALGVPAEKIFEAETKGRKK